MVLALANLQEVFYGAFLLPIVIQPKLPKMPFLTFKCCNKSDNQSDAILMPRINVKVN